MPTDKERREVAARLRALDVYEFDDGEYIDEGDVENALGIINVDGAWLEAVGVMRLADLIEPEELTCRMHRDEHGTWHCGNCDDSYRNGEGIVPWCDSWEPDFCPDCGARVIADA